MDQPTPAASSQLEDPVRAGALVAEQLTPLIDRALTRPQHKPPAYFRRVWGGAATTLVKGSSRQVAVESQLGYVIEPLGSHYRQLGYDTEFAPGGSQYRHRLVITPTAHSARPARRAWHIRFRQLLRRFK
jgi:hypothetical protein